MRQSNQLPHINIDLNGKINRKNETKKKKWRGKKKRISIRFFFFSVEIITRVLLRVWRNDGETKNPSILHRTSSVRLLEYRKTIAGFWVERCRRPRHGRQSQLNAHFYVFFFSSLFSSMHIAFGLFYVLTRMIAWALQIMKYERKVNNLNRSCKTLAAMREKGHTITICHTCAAVRHDGKMPRQTQPDQSKWLNWSTRTQFTNAAIVLELNDKSIRKFSD